MKAFRLSIQTFVFVCSFFRLSYVGAQTKTLTKDQYRDKTLAMLLGTCGGVVTGYEYLNVYDTPTGFYAPGASLKQPVQPLLGMPDDWFVPLNGTLGGSTKDEYNYFSNYEDGKIYSDDDQHVDFLNQYLLDKYGPSIAFQDIRDGWQYYNLTDFGATSDALNLIASKNLIAPLHGQAQHHCNGYWIAEGYIEHETMGAAFPGMPNKSAHYTERFSHMTCQGENVQWGQFWSAAHAIAYFETDARVVIEKALGVLPQTCYPRTLYQVVKDLYAKYPTDWRAAVKELWAEHARYPFVVGPDKIMLTAGVNNATGLLSILYGENDYMQTLKIVSIAGGDGDCSASTVCGLMGILKGTAGTPQAFLDHIYKGGKGIWINDLNHALHMGKNFPINWAFDDLTSLYQRNAERMILAYGGTVSTTGYSVATETPLLPSIAITNWDIEEGTMNGWKTTNTGGASVWAERQCDDNAHSCSAATGEYKITAITNSNTAQAYAFQTITGLKPNTTYLIEGRLNSAAGREARLYADNFGGTYTYTSIYQGLAPFAFRYLKITTGANATSMDVGLHAPPTTNGSKWCNIDDLTITELSDYLAPVKYEAEAATFSGGTLSSAASASGGKYVGGFSTAGSYLEFRNVQAAYSGEYVIRIHYANAANVMPLQKITVNGTDIGNVEYPDTGPWGIFSANVMEAPVRLKKGNNAIRLSYVSDSVEIDCIEVECPYGNLGKPADGTDLVSGGIYKIVSKNSNKVLDLKTDVANGTELTQSTYTGATSQYFQLQSRGGGLYTLSPLNTQLAVEIKGATTNNLDVVDIWDYWGGEGQQWAILDAGDGFFKLLNHKSGKAMDVLGLSKADGAGIVQYDYLGGDNQKWRFDFVGTDAHLLPHLIPGLFQAEAYSDSSGVQSEATTDAGGGEDIAYIENNDWVEYNVDVQTAGTYVLSFRIASATTGGKITVKSNGTAVGDLSLAGTGGWQTWKTVQKAVTLPVGSQQLRLEFTGGAGSLFNINWIDAEQSTVTGLDDVSLENQGFVPTASPNPFHGTTHISFPGSFDYSVVNVVGEELERGTTEDHLFVGEKLPSGVYTVKIESGKQNTFVKIIKQ